MSLGSILFPEDKRGFRGKRWVNISLRSLHLVGLLGTGSGILFSLPDAIWQNYLWLLVSTGSLMVAIELWTSAVWLVQLRGLSTVFKLCLLAALPLTEHDAFILILVVLISGVFAHAPANVRYYSVYHRRVL